MNYVEKLKQAITEEMLGQPEDLIEVYTLLGLMLGPLVDGEDVHNAWTVWKNKTDPDNEYIVRYEDLAPEVQELDTKYADAIVRAVIACK